MESKMLVLTVLMLSCMIQSSFALKCFACNSLLNPRCAELTDKTYQPQECVAQNFVSQSAGFLNQFQNQLGINSNFNQNTYVPICLKVVSLNGTTKVVERSCASRVENNDPCTLIRTAAQKAGVSTKLDYCGTCDTEGCNSGNSMQLFFGMIAFGVIASTARLFA